MTELTMVSGVVHAVETLARSEASSEGVKASEAEDVAGLAVGEVLRGVAGDRDQLLERIVVGKPCAFSTDPLAKIALVVLGGLRFTRPSHPYEDSLNFFVQVRTKLEPFTRNRCEFM